MSRPQPFAAGEDGAVRLYLKVTPGARKNSFDGTREDGQGRLRLLIKVTAAPEDGKANKAVIALLAGHLKLPKSAFTLAEGQTHREKQLVVDAPLARLQTAFSEVSRQD